MPRTKKVDANAPTTTKSTSTSKKMTAAEAKAFYEQNKSLLNFASAENALRQLVDTNKSSKYRTVSNFNKENLRRLAEDFVNLKPDSPQIFYIWGHAYEFDIDNSWAEFEEFCKFISGRDDIFYGTNTEVFL